MTTNNKIIVNVKLAEDTKEQQKKNITLKENIVRELARLIYRENIRFKDDIEGLALLYLSEMTLEKREEQLMKLDKKTLLRLKNCHLCK